MHLRYCLDSWVNPEQVILTLWDLRSRGVLLALRNAASFYQEGKLVKIAGPGKW